MKNKKDSNLGIIILLIVLVGSIGFVFLYLNMNNKNNTPKPKVVEEEKHTKEEINELYNYVKFSFEEDYSLTNEDLKNLDIGLTNDKFSDSFKVYLGIKSITSDYIGKINTKQVTDKDGYIYSGKYIKASLVKSQINRIMGNIQYKDTTIVLPNIKYVYNQSTNNYDIYEKGYNSKILKITHIESDYDDDNIYITEYSAYTNTSVNPNLSYTRHNKLLPINITKDNIVENLDIIDSYKYTFSLDKDSNNYILSKIEYIKVNE